MAGRAGRLGFNEQGKSIIYAETPYDRETLFHKYVLGTPESISSSFQPGDLPTWIVRLLAQVKRVVEADVPRLLANTYGGYIATRSTPSWRPEIERQIAALLERMRSLSLIEREGEYVQLTLLGRACGRSALTFESTMRLVELLRSIDQSTLSSEVLVAALQVLPESSGGYTPIMRRGQAERARSRDAVERYGSDVVRALQRYVDDEWDYYARCKRAAILWDWITGVPIDRIEQHYSPNPFQGRIGHGDIRRFADATRFHLRAAYNIAAALFVDRC